MLYVLMLFACSNQALITTNEGLIYNPSYISTDATEQLLCMLNVEIIETSYYPNSIYAEIIEPTITLISPEDSESFWNNIFVGEGDVSLVGGDERGWYTTVFGFNFHAISGMFSRIVDDYLFNEWLSQFHNGRRDNREFSKRTFIEDFGISLEQLIQAAEAGYGRPMHEIDALVNWARYYWFNDIYPPNTPPPYDTDLSVFFWASFRFSLSDWYALFSNDVETVWNAFPGNGVFHNGRAYSAEWIVQNMEQAIHVEGIPFHEIEGVFQRIDESFLAGMYEAVAAQSTFYATVAAIRALESE